MKIIRKESNELWIEVELDEKIHSKNLAKARREYDKAGKPHWWEENTPKKRKQDSQSVPI